MNDATGFYKLPADLGQDIETYATEVERFRAGELPPALFRAKRVPRGIYEQRKDGAYMVRVRVAGGAMTCRQAREIADLSRNYGGGMLHVTTRQDLQFHDVVIEDTPAIMRRLKAVGLPTKGGGGNTVRNVTVCAYAGICPFEKFDVTPFAHAITEYLIALPGSYNLPRKYKIAISGCEADCALSRVNDLGFVARVQDGKAGFAVFAGGGMGAHSRAADLMEEWAPASDPIRIAEAVRRLFDRFGNRADKHHARLRFVFEKMGPDAFRELLRKEMASLQKENVPDCRVAVSIRSPGAGGPARNASCGDAGGPPPVHPGTQETGGLRTVPQSQAEYVAVPLLLPLGFVSASDFEIIADVAEQFSEERGLRATRTQGLLLRFVRKDDLPALAHELARLSVDIITPSALDHFIVCAGATTCRLGLCHSRAAVRACAKALERVVPGLETLQDFVVNVSGCPNACGQHPIGTVGLFGAAQRMDGRLVPSYHMALGARNDERGFRLGTPVGTVPALGLPDFLAELVREFRNARQENESFGDFFDRKGKDYFQSLLVKYSTVPPYEQAPEFYRDWEQKEDFSLAGRGAGECGSGVFEVIQADLSEARKALGAFGASPGSDALFGAMLPTVRALLITRGVDTRDSDAILMAFEKHFVDTALVPHDFRELLLKGRGYLQGWRDALVGKKADIERLFNRVELLYSTLDASLAFHPPEEKAQTELAAPAKPPASESKALMQALNLSGVACPMNFVKAKLKLETMGIGDTLEVTLDEGEPIRNVPASFRTEGQDVLEVSDIENGHWKVIIRKVK